MSPRSSRYNILVFILVFGLFLCFCLMPAAAAEDMPRSFADVPPWITGDSGVRTPADGGYLVNDEIPADLGGISYGGFADAARDASEVPSWILAAAGISGLAVLAFASLHFLPILIGRTREVSPSPVRDSVLAAIRDAPGCSSADLREKTGLHHATLRYHLTVLEKEERIISRKAGHMYYYFQNGSSLSRTDTIRMTLCKNPTTEKVLGLIEKEPGISGTVLAARAGITPGTLTWHLGRLKKNGLITVSRAGRGMQIFPQNHT